ncbi:MAG: 2Fe-2S iron-sulfur cluster binding domain-containing protein [Cocleimonas sp.]|nr:2Fe-2S iron-sulfur cluster binding domain-containing protein [Cocleimonas sp.]
MPSITYQNKKYTCRPNETVLEVLLRNRISIPFSCKKGVCHVCVMHCQHGQPSVLSQQGLEATVKEKNHFKPCQCIPISDMEIEPHLVKKRSAPTKIKKAKTDYPPPDPEMWEAMEQGVLLSKILTTFYDAVFDDVILKPYFIGVTKMRLIEKVYSFHYQMFTGENVFFGERPRSSHHWMVISDEIFEHRQQLMEKSLKRHQLAPHLIKRWLDYEALYRNDIIKDKPIKKILFGEEVPLEGFEPLVMEFSSLCDSCQGEISVGDTVHYHTRMGTVYCLECMEQ